MRVCFEQQQQRARPPLEPPPTNGLCNNGLCVGHASVHSDSGSRAWGSGGCARCVEQQAAACALFVSQLTQQAACLWTYICSSRRPKATVCS